ncbi:MAG: cbb3-type cytochrome c oxidase subunit I [Phycisphaerae bacterium]|nr:cbb3-type cytochrome c oxidase subunit I [Phycisphaerae bacterium]
MTSIPVSPVYAPANYLDARRGIWSWLTTTDHKRIGILYFISMLIFFLFGAALAVTFRLELFSPGMQLFSTDVYNRLLTLHGVTMIFLFIIPGIPAIFGNFFLPIMLGAHDVAFPRLNLASWYCFVIGGVLALFAVLAGGVDTGWTFYVPYSIKTQANILYPMSAAFVLGWSSILTGLNFITTVHTLRAREITWFKMPLFIWSLYATSWVQLLATPIVGITLVMVLLERFTGVALFDPERGGDPILYQHMFWIYSHPAVYIMILPAMGVVSEIIPTFSRKTIFGYKFIAFSSVAIASIGSLVWAHHMFTAGMADIARIVFSFLTFLVAVPSAIKVFNWLATMYKGSIYLGPPMVWTLMFIVLFSIGGLTGLINGALSLNVHIHDTSFVVAHFHYTMFGGAAVIFFAAMHYWWPKMFGRLYDHGRAHLAAGLFFVGFNMTYFPLFIAGIMGMPRRYADYLPEYVVYHRLSTIGSWIMVSAILLMFGNLIYSLWKGRRAAVNPWGGATLEWQVPTPPPVENFVGRPDLSRGPYEYPAEVER